MNSIEKQKILFVTDARHTFSEKKGGVQVCTEEYINLLRASGFDVLLHPVEHTKKFSKRIKIKLGLDMYDRYDFDDLFELIEKVVTTEKIKYVALNQVGLSNFSRLLKSRFGDGVKVVILSHGNESGDFLHEINRRKSKSWLSRIRDVCRLGFFIANESRFFMDYVDLVLSMSGTELEINKWLGAKKGLFVPRTFSPAFLSLASQSKRIGFVGTLDHLPNEIGLEKFLAAFEKINSDNLKLRIVGGPELAGHRFQKRFGCVEYVGLLNDKELDKEASTWACSINPIFWYSRGASTKLAQLVNWGMPLVTTEAGNRGYIWKQGDLLVADDADDMAIKVKNLMASEGSIISCAAEVRKVALSGPSLTDISQQLNKLLCHL